MARARGESLQFASSPVAPPARLISVNGKAVANSPQPLRWRRSSLQVCRAVRSGFSHGELCRQCNSNQDVHNAKKAASIVLTADRSSITADRDDLAYVTASVVDEDGTLLPDARVALDFAVSGGSRLSAVGTGDPTDVSSFHQGKRTTWHGVAVAILRPTTTSAGSMKLTASASSPSLPQ